MAAYIIVNVSIHDADLYEDYKKLTPPSIAAFGGKFLVRGGSTEVLEGTPETGRVVVLEFADAATAKAWWDSDEYNIAKAIRQKASRTNMILVEGFTPTV